MGKKKADEDQGNEPSKWGKGKTDEASWFQPGCKPGPGRPKGSKNAKTIWQETNAEKVTMKVNGKPTRFPKGQVKYKQLANQAASGNLKATSMAIGLDEKWSPPENAPPSPSDIEADLSALQSYIDLQRKFAKTPETES